MEKILPLLSDSFAEVLKAMFDNDGNKIAAELLNANDLTIAFNTNIDYS